MVTLGFKGLMQSFLLWQNKISISIRLSWLENAYSRPLFSAGDFDPYSSQTEIDFVFGVRSGLISRSVRARLQVSVCSGYDLCQPG